MAFAALLGVTATSGVALADKGELRLVSRQSQADGGAGATSWSYGGSISDNGRFVAFRSEASNLGPHAASPASTIYVHDLDEQRVETVSLQSAEVGGQPANADSRVSAISGNGRYVAFRTEATNLGGPIVAGENVYVYDRKADRVQLVSRRSKKAGGGGANENSDSPSISANGRYIAYQTRSSNLGMANPDSLVRVYVYDRNEKRTVLVSRRSKGGKPADSNSFDASIAPRAPVVVFGTQADNLGGPTNPAADSDIYAYDWRTRRIELVSRRSKGGKGANDGSGLADVSSTGRFVVFGTNATNLGGPLQAPDGAENVYIHDRRTGRTSLISRRSKGAGGQGADAASGSPVIANSGRFVAFQTQATNLGGPVASPLNVYVYDRKRKRAILASRASDGGPGANEYAAEPEIAGAAPFVTFYTPADNIDPPGEPAYHGNFPAATNVYRFQFGN